MKKIFTLLLAVFALTNANAQFLSAIDEPDELYVNRNGGSTQIFNSTDVKNIDFTDPQNIIVNKWDGGYTSFLRNSIQDLRFRSRYSDPEKLLTSGHFGGYETMFLTTRDCQGSYFLYASLASDEMLGGGGLLDHYRYYDYLTDPHGTNFATSFSNSYLSIAQINKLLEHFDNIPADVDKDKVNHAKGELLFLRAHHHYELASMYGPVQVVTDNNSWEQKVKTFTPEMTWGQIMLDLKNAVELMDGSLCPSLREDGRVSRYAAEALLARAFLFYTGFYQGKHDIAAQEASVNLPDGTTLTKQDVIDYLSDCITNSPFQLVSDFRNIWPYTNSLTVEDNPETANQGLKWVEDYGAINPEVLFKIRYNEKSSWSDPFTRGYSNQYALWFGHYCLAGHNEYEEMFPIGSGWGAGSVAPNLYDDWSNAEPDDMRRNASIKDLGNTSYKYFSYVSDVAQLTQYHELKNSPISEKSDYSSQYDPFEVSMFQGGSTLLDNNMQGGNIHPLNLIRLSDVLLMHSELTGTVDGINKVRQRAGLPAISTYSLEALQQERRWELAFEGVRWNDMRRWGDDYCKAALDKQLNQPIIYMGNDNTNTPDLFGFKSYSEQYAENHGFVDRPDGTGECAAVYTAMAGTWYLGELNGITSGTLNSQNITADDFLTNQKGLIQGYTIDEMKKQSGYTDGEISKYSYMTISGNSITTVSSHSETIAEGTIELSETNNYDWRICKANITDKAILGSNASQFDVISIDENTMVLVETQTPGTPAHFCVFKKGVSPEYSMHALVNKKWSYGVSPVWDYSSYPYEYAYVGPWGYGGYSSSGFGVPVIYCSQFEGALPEQLADYANNWGLQEKRDADPYAYMVFDLYDETVSKYTRDGQLIAKGKFECDKPEWGVQNDIEITVHNNATLFPYSFYGEGKTVEQFIVRYGKNGQFAGNNYEALTLREKGNNSGFTFWTFGIRGIAPEEMDDMVVINQYDKDGNPAADGCYFMISFKDGVNRRFEYECTDGTAIKYFDGYYRVNAERGTTVQKDIRVWTVNCNNDTVSTTRTLTFKMDLKPAKEVVIWEDPNGVVSAAWDAATFRFSDNEGRNFPYLSDEVYWGYKTLIFDICDATDDCYGRVMNGWWSARYDGGEDVHFTDGPWELPLTEEIARDCARGNGGAGKDLDLMITRGVCTITKVYYLEE